MTQAPATRRLRLPWWMASAVLLAVAALGFVPSYGHHLSLHRRGIHLHAAVCSAWLLLLIAQRGLIAWQWRRAHRILGWSTVGVGAAVVWSGLAMLRDLAARGPLSGERVHDLTLAASGLAVFAAAWLWATLGRRDRAIHARAMLWTGIALGWAGLHRALLAWVPGLDTPRWAALASTWLLLCCSGLLWIDDLAADDRARRVHSAGCVALLLTLLALDRAGSSVALWHAAAWLASWPALGG